MAGREGRGFFSLTFVANGDGVLDEISRMIDR
jgi:hypothetical protein